MSLKTTLYCKDGDERQKEIAFKIETADGMLNEYVAELYNYYVAFEKFGSINCYDPYYEKFGPTCSVEKMISRLKDELDCFEKDHVFFRLFSRSKDHRVEMHIFDNKIEFRCFEKSCDHLYSLNISLKNNRIELINLFNNLILIF